MSALASGSILYTWPRPRKAKLLAFEPPSESFLALMNNIKLNSFEDQLIPRCFALDERELLAGLYIKSREAGAPMHSFDSEVSAEGRINSGFAQPTIAVSADFLHSNFDLPPQSLLRLILMEMRCETRKEDETYLWNTQGP